ncbi:MAG: adenylosuccinate synthase [Planctomycetes bacterium]|nr:adenylosuccinate synthase [Planctomycetota bacterium]
MGAIGVFGAQWGDEGKGKIIDILAGDADLVVRFAGGNNAGHTVVIEGRRYAVHLVPSGIFREGAVNVIGNGVVIDPWHLRSEIDGLVAGGVAVVPGKNLLISRSAHIILPFHRTQDLLAEQLRGPGKIGTTGRGIGPAYQDRAARSGVRFGDALDPAWLRQRVEALVTERNALLTARGQDPVDAGQLFAELMDVLEPLLPAATDGGLFTRTAIADGRKVLFEGAQGLLLDVDLGTFPYVTSTSVGVGGIGGGAGVSPRAIDEVILVAKAYTTRVGEGPFPTELEDATGERIREQGNEFGTTTGRPRRCGWFDAGATRYVVEVSAADSLYLTNLDVLSGFETVSLGIAYRNGEEVMRDFPAGLPRLEELEVDYEECPGWEDDLTAARRFEDLPANARDYVLRLEETLGVAIPLVSVGPDRDQVIRRGSPNGG